MAVMRGKFHVWGDGDTVFFVHGKDVTEEHTERRERLLRSRLGADVGREITTLLGQPETPPDLRTGVVTPMSFWLPKDVFLSLAVRVCDSMTEEEREAYRGPTAWEDWYDKMLDP